MKTAILWAFYGTGFTFLMTSLGSALVFFFKNTISNTFERIFLGFAAGIMIAASFWSLLLPALEQARSLLLIPYIPASVGISLGAVFLFVMDKAVSHIYKRRSTSVNINEKSKRTAMLIAAITLHNIPEGMAVGVIYAGFLAGDMQITAASALALSLGIAIQNFPEGAIISLPLRAEGEKKSKAFLGGVLSGVVEPIGAVLTLAAAQLILPALPYLLSFAAGAMLYVVIEEMIPEMSQGKHSNIGTLFFAVGFSIMMMLDVALG